MKNSSIQEVLQSEGYEGLVRLYMEGNFIVPRSGPVVILVDYNTSLDEMIDDCAFRCISHHLKPENYHLEGSGKVAFEIEFGNVYYMDGNSVQHYDEQLYPPLSGVVSRPLLSYADAVPWQQAKIEHALAMHKKFPLEATISPFFALGSRLQKPTEYAHAPRIGYRRPQDLESQADLHLCDYENVRYHGRSLLVRPFS